MNNKIIIINGCAEVGKDTFVKFCQQANNDVLNISTIDYIKQVAKDCGWNGEKTEKNRKFLSDLKDLLTDWDDVPFKYIVNFISNISEKIIFIHCREPKEIVKLYNYFKQSNSETMVTTLLIKNCNVSKIKSNHADANVENLSYDFTIYNDYGKSELKTEAENFLKSIERI